MVDALYSVLLRENHSRVLWRHVCLFFCDKATAGRPGGGEVWVRGEMWWGKGVLKEHGVKAVDETGPSVSVLTRQEQVRMHRNVQAMGVMMSEIS